MKQSSFFLPIVLIIFGAVWFLSSTDILPTTATLLALALVLGGLALLLLDGINTQSIVHGPMLMYIGAAIYLRNQMFINTAPLAALRPRGRAGLMRIPPPPVPDHLSQLQVSAQ